MTANYIAKVVQSQFDKINIDEINSEFAGIEKYKYGRISDEWINKRIENKQYYRWLKSCNLLEDYIKQNFEKFEQTELVYYWAKDLCDRKNKILNEWRAYGAFTTFKEFIKK